MPSDHLYCIRPKQVVSRGWAGSCLGKVSAGQTGTKQCCLCQVVPAGGSNTIFISFTPMVLDPHVLHKVECVGYALGFMSLDSEVSPPGGMGPQPLPLWGSTLPARPATAVTRLALGRWKGSFQGGGGVCRTLPWDP